MKSVMLDCPDEVSTDTLFRLEWDTSADNGRGGIKLKPVQKVEILKQMVADYCQGHQEEAIPSPIALTSLEAPPVSEPRV